jgi:hypothetical protein
MYHAANEIIHATQEGGTERALWWLRWLIEEDAALRARNKVGLTTLERGSSGGGGRGGGGGKRRGLMGAYVAAVLAECYKELAGKGLIRLHDEFQCLLDLSRVGAEVGLTPKRQTDCLALMIQILAEIPKWKNPSCPPLLTLSVLGSAQGGFQSSGTDDLVLARAVSQAEMFWREILALPPLEKSLPTAIKAKAAAAAQRKKNAKKGDVTEKISQMDQFYLNFYNI